MLLSSASHGCRPPGVCTSFWHAQLGVRQGQLHSAVVRHSKLEAAATTRTATFPKQEAVHGKQNMHRASRSGAHGSITSTLEQDSSSSLQDKPSSKSMSACSNAQRAGNKQDAGMPLTDIEKQHMLLRVLQEHQAASSASSSGGTAPQQALSRVYVSGSADKGPNKKFMEDRHTLAALCAVNGPLDNWTSCIDLVSATAFAAVYDGHGGHMTAAHAAHQLHHHLHRKLHHHNQHHHRHNQHHHHHRHSSSSRRSSSDGGGGSVVRSSSPVTKYSRQHSATDLQLVSALQHTFSEFDDHWRDETMGMQFDHSGSTAVVALVNQHSLVVANAGDSVAVLARGGSAVRLSHLHKPGSDEAESARVAAAGGVFLKGKSGGLRVMQNPASLPAGERYAKQPHLAVTRSLGDYKLKRHGYPIVSSQPHIHQQPLTQQDTLLLLASDGVADVLSDQQMVDAALSAVQQACSCSDSNEDLAQAAAAAVKAEALEAGAWDNVTVVAMYLDWA